MARRIQIQVPVTMEEAEQLTDLARKAGISRATFLRRAIKAAAEEWPEWADAPATDRRQVFREV